MKTVTKEQLIAAVQAAKGETKEALETILSVMNNGQRKKAENHPAVQPLLERYGVEIEE